MINKKTNCLLNTFFIIIALYSLNSCNKHKYISFEKQIINTNDLLECNDVDCAIIDVQVIQAINDSKISVLINTVIENQICATLDMEENKTSNSIKEAIIRFNKSYQDITEEYPEETVPYEVKIISELGFQNKNIVSVFIDSYVYTGGAHGNGNSTYINFYSKNGERMNNNNLFKDYNKFHDFAEKAFRKKYTIPENESINNTGFFFKNDKFILPENIGFTSDSVILHYNQYEISSFADAPIKLTLPKKEIIKFFDFTIL